MEIQIPSLLRIKPNALYKIGKYLRKDGFDRIALFYGQSMKALVGQHLDISLDSSEIRVVHEEDISNNRIDQVFKSTFSLPRTAQAIVAVGGGTVIDYAKYIAFMAHMPIITIPTAISNDGFASPMASLYVEGKRRSLKAKIPFGVILDTSIIKSSPQKFTYSGIGDLISKYSAIHDWKLSYRETGEPVNDFAVMIAMTSVENLVHFPDKSLQDLEFLRLVCGALVMSGVAMEVSGSSRPASGSEHLISHAYDKIAAQPSLHGLQVGVATLATTWLQNHPKRHVILRVFEETGFTRFMATNPLCKADFLSAIEEAPAVKEGYFTVLSEVENRRKLIDHVKTDPFWEDYLR